MLRIAMTSTPDRNQPERRARAAGHARRRCRHEQSVAGVQFDPFTGQRLQESSAYPDEMEARRRLPLESAHPRFSHRSWP